MFFRATTLGTIYLYNARLTQVLQVGVVEAVSGKKVIDPIVVLKALVKPVVRYCLRKGIRSGQVERLVREVFVDGARQAIEAAQGELSISKVSVMTGINRMALLQDRECWCSLHALSEALRAAVSPAK